MGHYYAEMMCEECGQLRCACPPAPKKPGHSWVLDGFTPIKAEDYAKQNDGGGFGFFRSMMATRYKDLASAQAAANAKLDEAIEATSLELVELVELKKARLKERAESGAGSEAKKVAKTKRGT